MNIKLFLTVGMVLLGTLLPSSVVASTLSLSPSSNSIVQGQTVSVSVFVTSTNEAINAASGVVSFSSGVLEVVSISKASSVATLWVQEPSYSNASGNISFEGVVLNPGFIGSAGRVITIVFRGKSPGTANLLFSSSSVLANDGQGTETLRGASGTTITVTGATPVPVVQPPKPLPQESTKPTTGSATKAIISSPSHPDQARWYKDGSPDFKWTLPAGTQEVRVLLTDNPKDTPSVKYTTPITSKSLDNVPDGTHYFLVQPRTAEGLGVVSKFQLNIDTTSPEKFKVTFPDGADNSTPQPRMLFMTEDEDSGVDRYEVLVDGKGDPVKTTSSTEANTFVLTTQEPGKHTVTVTAYDRAGNSMSAEGVFTVLGIDPPIIVSYSEAITIGESLTIQGTTYPNATIDIAVSQGERLIVIESTKSSAQGDFGIILSKQLWAGAYTFTARVTDDRGARSAETEPKSVTVRFHFINDAVTFILNYFVIAVSALIGIALIVALGLWSWFRLIALSRKLKKESDEAQSILHRSFKLLRADLEEHIRKLKKAGAARTLSAEEIEFLELFETELSQSEEIIARKVRKISSKKRAPRQLKKTTVDTSAE